MTETEIWDWQRLGNDNFGKAVLRGAGEVFAMMNASKVSALGALLAISLAVPRPAQSAEPAIYPATPDQYARVIRGNSEAVTIFNSLVSSYLFFYQGPLVWNSTVDMPGSGITVAVDPPSGTLSSVVAVPLKISVGAAASTAKGTTTGKITFETLGIYDPLGQYLNSSDLRLRVEVAADNTVRIFSGGGSSAYLECDAGSTASLAIKLINSGPDRLYQWKVAMDVPWLSVSSAAGDFIKTWEEGGFAGSETNLTLTASAGSLAPGTYSGKLVVTAANLKTASYEYPVSFKIKPASTWAIFSLDQKLLARGTDLRLAIHGVNLKVPVTPQFLLEDGSVDGRITFGSVAVNGTDRIEAVCTTAVDAALGKRTLQIQSGGKEAKLPNAVQVVGFRMEVNQGAKTEPDAVRVASHPTVVRAFVDSAGPVGDLVGRLYVFGEGGQQIYGSPFSPNAPSPTYGSDGSPLLEDVLHVNPPYTHEERLYLRDSLNFYNSSWSGRLDFWLTVSATDPAVSPAANSDLTRLDLQSRLDFLVSHTLPVQDFRNGRPYRVLALIDNRLSPAAVRQIEARLDMAAVYVNAAFPGTVSLHTRDDISKEALNLDALKPAAWNPFGNWWANVHARLARYLAIWNETSSVRYDQIALATDGTGVQAICGSGTLGMADKQTSFIVGDYPTTFAHELAHNFGLGDTYCGFGCGNLLNPLTPCYLLPVNCRRGDALPGGNRVEDGAVRLAPLFDSRGKPLVGATVCVAWPGYQRIDLMGTANDETRWPDLVEWNHLFGVLQAPAPVAALAAAGGEYLSVRGVIGIDDSVGMVQFAKESQPSLGGSLPDGDYRIELVNASGTVLSSRQFGVDFRASGAGLATSVGFASSTPWTNGAALARIRRATRVLISQALSAHAPVVAVTEPAGGLIASNPITVRWNGADADGDTLTFTVFYIKDDGTPEPLAADLTTTSYSWNPGRVSGCSQGRIRVVASDGINQSWGESAPFSLARQPPSVVFLAPEPDIAVRAGFFTTLSGAGTDPEDGFLPPESLSYRSSLDGELGQGAVVSKVLSTGVHVLTLRGVDKDGNVAQASINLTVGAANQVPVVESITPNFCAPGTTVTLAGRNFDPVNGQVRLGASLVTVSSASTTQSVVRIPDGLAPGTVPVSVISHGFTSEPVSLTIIAGRPRVLGLVPPAGTPGTPVMVRVAEVDTTANPTVRFGDLAAVTLGISGDGLLVAVPAGVVPGDVPVIVSLPPLTSAPVTFRVLTGDPLSRTVVRMILPDFGAAGDVVRFLGSGFSPVLAENLVSFGGVAALPASASAEELVVQVPAGIKAGPTTAWVSVQQYPSNPLTFTARASSGIALSIVTTKTGFEISWSATAVEYILEVADQLWPAGNWKPSTALISVRGDRKVAEVPAVRATQFFRLRKGS